MSAAGGSAGLEPSASARSVRGAILRSSLSELASRAISRRWSLTWLAALGLAAAATSISPPDWTVGVAPARCCAPGLDHPLGTDHLGRDLLLRVVGGAASAVVPASLAALVAWVAGAPLGFARAARQPWRRALADLVDTGFGSTPSLILALLVASITRGGPWTVAAVIGLASAPLIATPLAAKRVALHDRGFFDAHRAHGSSRADRAAAVVLSALPDLVRATLEVLTIAVTAEATLSYLGGFGTPEPTPSWGNMIAFDWGHAHTFGGALPALALSATLLALHRQAGAFSRGVASLAPPSLVRLPAPPPHLSALQPELTPPSGLAAELEPRGTAAARSGLIVRELRIEQGDTTLLHLDALDAPPGALVALIGPSGAGKSLTGAALAGVCRVAGARVSGFASLDGRPLTLGADTSRVPQLARAALDPLRRVGADVPDAGALRSLLAAVQLDPAVADAWPHTLSGGMATRAAVAVALARGARVIIADEPLAGLDPLSAARVLTALRTAADRGATVLWITHHLGHALRHADQLVMLRAGQVAGRWRPPWTAGLETTLTSMLALHGEASEPAPTGPNGAAGASTMVRPDADPGRREVGPADDEAAIQLDRTTISARVGMVSRRTLLRVDHLALPTTGRVAVVGRSGSGKSTLARLLAGVARPDDGARRSPLRHGEVQLLPQDPLALLLEDVEIGAQIALACARHGRPAGQARRLLRDLGLAGLEHALPGRLSGGQLRRAQLAIALAAQPRVLIADEPTDGLDAALRPGVLRRVFNAAPCVVVITHEIAEVTPFVDRVIVLDEGAVVDDFPASELERAERHPITRSLRDAGRPGRGEAAGG